MSTCYAYAFDDKAWSDAYDILNAQSLKVTEWKDTKIKGTITAEDAGLLFTSIPYDPGWSIYLDGKEIEPGKICDDALIGVSITPGKHTVEFSYIPQGFIPGIIISIISILLLVFIAKREDFILWYDNRKRSKTLEQ